MILDDLGRQREVGESEPERRHCEKDSTCHCWPGWWRKEPWAKGCGWPLESEKGKEMDFPLEPPEGTSPANTFILAEWNWFWASELWDDKIKLF